MIPQPINCYYTLKEIEAKKDYNVITVDDQFIHANAFIYNTNTTDALEFNTSQGQIYILEAPTEDVGNYIEY